MAGRQEKWDGPTEEYVAGSFRQAIMPMGSVSAVPTREMLSSFRLEGHEYFAIDLTGTCPMILDFQRLNDQVFDMHGAFPDDCLF